ncbi:MAG: choice-of-anchor Q domain-containing protein, partial [Candidatus Methylomirabilales bacterium]
PGDGICATAGGQCTLRAAIQEANALAGADTIILPAGTYPLTTPGTGENLAARGDRDITPDLIITGANAASTIIEGNGMDRGLDIFADADVAISGVTIRNGNAGAGALGGGIRNFGTLTLTDVTINGNTAGTFGGGIANNGTLILTNVTISTNTGKDGGGLFNGFEASATLTNVTISTNTASSRGGGIFNIGTLELTNATISTNTASSGGGLLNNGGSVALKDTIVANSPSGGNCAGSGVTSLGHNLEDADTCGFTSPGDLINTDPLLGPLAANGGPTSTHALLPGSPAIDAGSLDCPPPDTDQRGLTRPQDGNGDSIAVCDIGAYEFGAAPPPSFLLSVSVKGKGTVTGPGIDCRMNPTRDPDGCTEAYPSGTEVTLMATPDSEFRFVRWRGACAEQGNPCSLTMDGDKSVTAIFRRGRR